MITLGDWDAMGAVRVVEGALGRNRYPKGDVGCSQVTGWIRDPLDAGWMGAAGACLLGQHASIKSIISCPEGYGHT